MIFVAGSLINLGRGSVAGSKKSGVKGLTNRVFQPFVSISLLLCINFSKLSRNVSSFIIYICVMAIKKGHDGNRSK